MIITVVSPSSQPLAELLEYAGARHECAARIREKLLRLFELGGCMPSEASVLVPGVLAEIAPPFTVESAEQEIRHLLGHALIRQILGLYTHRHERVCAQIQEWIAGDRILDLGGGNGLIGGALGNARGVSVTISDVKNYNATHLPFIPLTDGVVEVPDNSFSTVLLIAVLHHAEVPQALMREAARLGKRTVVIESVYDGSRAEESLPVTAFFDWFINRVLLENGVPMPCRYNTLDGWQTFFEAQGYGVAHQEFLGEDHPGLPLTHALYVLDHG